MWIPTRAEGNGAPISQSWADRQIFWGCSALFFFLPLTTSGVSLAGGWVILVWLFSGKFFRERGKWLHQPWTAPVALFMLLPWVGLIWSDDKILGLDWATKSFIWFLSFAVVSLACERQLLPFFLKWFLAGLVLVSVISLLQYFSVLPMKEQVPSLLEGSRITGSLFLVFGMLILSFEYRRCLKMGDKIVLLLTLTLFFVTLLATGGRAGYLAFVLLLPLMVYHLAGGIRLLFKVLIGLVVVALLFLSPVVIDRTVEIGQDLTLYRQKNPNTSVGIRLHMWEGAVKIFRDNPLLGAGTGGYKKEMEKLFPSALALEFQHMDDPHNSFLFMAANYGLVGLFSIGWLFYVFLQKGWRSRHVTAGFALLSYGLVLIIGSMTSTEIHSFHSGNLFALLMGIQIEPGEPPL
ncbi:MAG: O-antigen ligase family protein [Smithellaceae bacterium]|nr:O-antigen ligase family protein [Smithellaceae bacterium]